jgi:hypothetical protein
MTDRSELPGLQSERTALAWDRTAVSAAAVAGVLLFHEVAAARIALSISAGVLALAILVLSWRRRGLRTPPTVAAPIVGWGTAILAVVLLAGLFLVGL